MHRADTFTAKPNWLSWKYMCVCVCIQQQIIQVIETTVTTSMSGSLRQYGAKQKSDHNLF